MSDSVPLEMAGSTIEEIVVKDVEKISKEVENRAYRASNELRNAAMIVLRGERSGRRYKIPGTYRKQRDKTTKKIKSGVYYTASAPGEAPANRTGLFRMGWNPKTFVEHGDGHSITVHATIENNQEENGYLLGEILENGTKKGMKPRWYKDKVMDAAEPQISRIYHEPYNV